MLEKLSPYRPILLLFVLAPFIGEVLSTSTPLIAFFNPWNLFFLGGLYGAGAILARELMVMRGKGWPTLLLLGIAYGIIEEGLAIKSFFDPNWKDLGSLVGYDYQFSVNWVWTVHLTLFHMVYSIAISVFLTELTFPATRQRRWTDKRTFRILAGLFVFTVFLFYSITEYDPPPVPYLLAFVLVVVLVMNAHRLPVRLPPRPAEVPPPIHFLIGGFVIAVVWFLSVWIFPEWNVPQLALVAWLLVWCGLASAWILRQSGNGSAWTQKHQLALASGFLGFLMLLVPVAAVAMIGFLLWLWLRLQRPVPSAKKARKSTGSTR